MKENISKILLFKNIIKRDLQSSFPISFRIKLKMWKRGFLSEKYVLYNLSENDWMKFLSDYHARQTKRINDPYTLILDNKLLFHSIVGEKIKVPKNYALVKMGKVYPLDKEKSIQNFDQLIQFIRKRSIVLKPVYGGGGKGVMLISNQNGSLTCNRKAFNEKRLKESIINMDDILITEFIEQGHFPKELYPDSVNTMRIVTLRDVDNGKFFIARAVQRIGNKNTAPQDNFTKGGMSSMIDLESGTLSSAATHPKSKILEWFDSHPNTGISIVGQQIPQWDQTKKAILEAAQKLPFLNCIGWDVLLTESGPVALEGNSHPDPDVLQCHGPLLQNERIYRFYQYYGII